MGNVTVYMGNVTATMEMLDHDYHHCHHHHHHHHHCYHHHHHHHYIGNVTAAMEMLDREEAAMSEQFETAVKDMVNTYVYMYIYL
jgi:hypothetical protein